MVCTVFILAYKQDYNGASFTVDVCRVLRDKQNRRSYCKAAEYSTTVTRYLLTFLWLCVVWCFAESVKRFFLKPATVTVNQYINVVIQ